MWSENKVSWLRVARSVSSITFHSLRRKYKNPNEALEYLLKLGKKVVTVEEIQTEIHKTEKFGARMIWIEDIEYPALLKQISDAPGFITVNGKIDLNSHCISIVGSRNSSLNSNRIASTLAERLAECGYTIVSGLARGVDRHAHLGAISKTVAVIACGIDHVYPKDNQDLYQKIPEQGAIVTEFPIGTSPTPTLFPSRNRIIAGMSVATIVVQASNHSGSLITAQCAIEYNRDVFAVPGCPLDPRSYGANNLIKNGAPLIQDYQDVLHQLNSHHKDRLIDRAQYKAPKSEQEMIDDIGESDMCTKILSCLSSEPVKIDDLCVELDMSASLIRQTLIELELAGKVTLRFGDKVAKEM